MGFSLLVLLLQGLLNWLLFLLLLLDSHPVEYRGLQMTPIACARYQAITGFKTEVWIGLEPISDGIRSLGGFSMNVYNLKERVFDLIWCGSVGSPEGWPFGGVGGVQVESRWWWGADPGGDDGQVQVVDSRCRRSWYGGGICSGLELWQTWLPQW
jgi:hypothetical protein